MEEVLTETHVCDLQLEKCCTYYSMTVINLGTDVIINSSEANGSINKMQRSVKNRCHFE